MGPFEKAVLLYVGCKALNGPVRPKPPKKPKPEMDLPDGCIIAILVFAVAVFVWIGVDAFFRGDSCCGWFCLVLLGLGGLAFLGAWWLHKHT